VDGVVRWRSRGLIQLDGRRGLAPRLVRVARRLGDRSALALHAPPAPKCFSYRRSEAVMTATAAARAQHDHRRYQQRLQQGGLACAPDSRPEPGASKSVLNIEPHRMIIVEGHRNIEGCSGSKRVGASLEMQCDMRMKNPWPNQQRQLRIRIVQADHVC
jgi:hypothetical protein